MSEELTEWKVLNGKPTWIARKWAHLLIYTPLGQCEMFVDFHEWLYKRWPRLFRKPG